MCCLCVSKHSHSQKTSWDASKLTVYILHSFRRSYSKTRALRMTDHRRLWRELPSPLYLLLSFSLPLSVLSLSFLCQKGLSLYPCLLPPPTSPPPPLPHPWLERVASECQMYYRVSHGNVNTQPCHESRVVWPPSFPSLPSPPIPPSSPFLSSLPHSADCQRGGESTKQQRERVYVLGGDGAREEAGV